MLGLKQKKMKDFLRKINPIAWVERGFKKRVIRLALDFIEGWILRRVRYLPIQDYLTRKTNRLEELFPFLLAGDAVNDALKAYWEENKVELFRDQMTLLRAILSEEVRDPRLLAKLDNFAADMEKYLKEKI